jgi:hypothetical protein
VRAKHNDTSSRTDSAEGWAEIDAQIARAVKLAVEIARPESLELFARLRQKREQGRYRRVIMLEPVLRGQRPTAIPLPPRQLSMSGSFAALPQPLADAVKKVAGRKKQPLIDFATKLLNLIRANKDTMNVSEKKLVELLGYKDGKRARKYRDLLVNAGLITVGRAYSAGAFSKRHSLTAKAQRMFQEAQGHVQAV